MTIDFNSRLISRFLLYNLPIFNNKTQAMWKIKIRCIRNLLCIFSEGLQVLSDPALTFSRSALTLIPLRKA